MVATFAVKGLCEMKRIGMALFLVLACTSVDAVPARVVRVIDGDTFSARVMLNDDINVAVRVRLRNVDTPEIKGECEYERKMAARARDALEQMIPVGSIVELDNVQDDKYVGRIDANVYDSSGADVGLRLIKSGLGRAYSGGRRAKWCR